MVTRRPIIKGRKNTASIFSIVRSFSPSQVIIYAFIKGMRSKFQLFSPDLIRYKLINKWLGLSLSLDSTGQAVENGPWIVAMANNIAVMK